MAAAFVSGYTFGATELVTNTKLHLLVTAATVSGILGTELSSSASIAASQLDIGDFVFYGDDMVSWGDEIVYY